MLICLHADTVEPIETACMLLTPRDFNQSQLDILPTLQTMIRLQKLLKRDNITYSKRIFETEDGIIGLGAEPFVRKIVMLMQLSLL